jgi:hypothetical protein
MSVHEVPALTRREQKALLRGERDGSGPVRPGTEVNANPGATGRFALFGEVLVTGVLITIAGIAVVTMPAALAAGIRHLRRCVAAEDSRMILFWQDLRKALLPGAVVGVVVLVLTMLLLLDIVLAGTGVLPGGIVVTVIGWIGLAAVAVALLAGAGAWTPEHGWRSALRSVPSVLRADAVGALYLVATAGFVIVVTWALAPLFIAAIGCAALAVVAIPARPRRRGPQAAL